MIACLLLAAGIAATPFEKDFPGASTIKSADGKRLKSASGFAAKGLGDTAESAARAFLAKYGGAFGIGPRFELAARGAPAAGQPGAARFERRLDGLPVFDGDVVVGVDGANTIILVNAADVPSRVRGRARLSRAAAIAAAKKAIPGLVSDDTPRAERGFKAVGKAIHPVWRVEFTASRPPGDFRTDVDAQTGVVLSRISLRADAGSGIAPPRNPELSPKR